VIYGHCWLGIAKKQFSKTETTADIRKESNLKKGKSAKYHLNSVAWCLILIVFITRGTPHLSKIESSANFCEKSFAINYRLMLIAGGGIVCFYNAKKL